MIPDFQSLMRPVLDVLADAYRAGDGALDTRSITARVADRLALSEADRTERTSSGRALLEGRVSFAVSYLAKAGALDRPSRGTAQINETGSQLLARGNGPVRVDRYPEFKVRLKPE